MVKISPSLLSANFACLDTEIQSVTDAGVEWLHYDVMDGHFVPNISFGYSILGDVKKVTDLYLDVHLMISSPQQYVDEFIKNGASLITFHYEALESTEEIHDLIKHIHEAGVDAGISIKPNTPVDVLKPFLNDLELVLIMSVEPGFGGQSFQPTSLDKVKELKALQKDYHYVIEIDGGINAETGKQAVEAGVDVLVAGSYIFNNTDRKEAVKSLR